MLAKLRNKYQRLKYLGTEQQQQAYEIRRATLEFDSFPKRLMNIKKIDEKKVAEISSRKSVCAI